MSAASESRAEPVATKQAEPPEDPVEAIFAFRDDIERVQLQIGFEPDARNPIELVAACKAVAGRAPVFMAALGEIDDTVAGDLRRAAGPMISVCDAPLAASPAQELAVLEGFSQFWEASFDVAA